MFKFFKRQPKDEPNPWLKVKHDCDWLPANAGKELVCGICGRRKPVRRRDGKKEN